MPPMNQLARDFAAQFPEPTDTPLARMAHTLDVWTGEPDSMKVLTATTNIYGPQVWTGITLGDLRALFNAS